MSSPSSALVWKPCNICKKEVRYGATYWVCNVSTCNRRRTGLIFCNVSCWDAHLPDMNHREAWAIERKAPKNAQEALLEESAPVRDSSDKPRSTPTTHSTPGKNTAVQTPPRVILRRRPAEE